MTVSKAQREFRIRYYLWAIPEFEKEIDESFPGFKSFPVGPIAQTAQFMRRLDKPDQRLLASGLIKRAHAEAVHAAGEFSSKAEKKLVALRDSYCNMAPLCPTAELLEPGVTRLAGKAKLRKTLLKQFKDTFGTQCFDLASVGMDPELDFKTELAGWVLTTHFEFHGRNSQMEYWSSILSPTEGRYGGPAMVLVDGIGFTGWLGLYAQTTSEWLTEKDIEPACAAAIGFCARFFDVAPKLLSGLEFDRIAHRNEKPV